MVHKLAFALHLRGEDSFFVHLLYINPNLSIVACQSIISFMSMFLQEYIKLFPKAKEVFDKKTDLEKWLLTMHDYRKNK